MISLESEKLKDIVGVLFAHPDQAKELNNQTKNLSHEEKLVLVEKAERAMNKLSFEERRYVESLMLVLYATQTAQISTDGRVGVMTIASVERAIEKLKLLKLSEEEFYLLRMSLIDNQDNCKKLLFSVPGIFPN